MVEEPDGRAIKWWDSVVHWGHSPEAYFELDDLARALEEAGLHIERHLDLGIFGVLGARRPDEPPTLHPAH